jgi:hypothetical protein
MVVGYCFGTILYLYIVVLLLKELLSQKVITANLIYCAISIYLLIGVMWAGVYTVQEGISPGSFSGLSLTTDLLYFSFVTLTTVGFGDVAPLSILAKRFAIFEAAMGSIYMVSFRQACMNFIKRDAMIGYPTIQKRITDGDEKLPNATSQSQRSQRAIQNLA